VATSAPVTALPPSAPSARPNGNASNASGEDRVMEALRESAAVLRGVLAELEHI
jgi:hypothetical protein